MSEWRPKDWNETYYRTNGFLKGHGGEPESNFEAGADAMLAVLKKAGEHLEEDFIFETWTTEPGTWVFIPDEE